MEKPNFDLLTLRCCGYLFYQIRDIVSDTIDGKSSLVIRISGRDFSVKIVKIIVTNNGPYRREYLLESRDEEFYKVLCNHLSINSQDRWLVDRSTRQEPN